MNSICNLFFSTKAPIMLYKNILFHDIHYCNYRNPIISIMRDNITWYLIANFCYFVFSRLPDQKSSLRKFISYRVNVRKAYKTITNLVFNKLTAIVLKGRNDHRSFGAR